MGRPPKQHTQAVERDVMVRISITPDEWREVRSAAALDGKPLRSWIADVIRFALEQRQNGKS